MSNRKIHLGDKVKDKVSGLEGIAMAQHTYLNGCDRFSIQPPVTKVGELPDSATFDEPQLELVEEAVVTTVQRQTGGPERYSDESRR